MIECPVYFKYIVNKHVDDMQVSEERILKKWFINKHFKNLNFLFLKRKE